MGQTARRAAPALLGLAALLVLGRVLLESASFAAAPLELDVGPGTGRYLEGFTESEERLPVTFRWTTSDASVALPIELSGDGTLELRYARFLPGSATVRWFAGGAPAGAFSARSGRFRTEVLPVSIPGEELSLAFNVEDPAPEGLGLAVDWIRLEGLRPRLPFSFWQAPLLLGGVFLLSVATGFTAKAAFGLGALLAAAQALWLARDPVAMAHVHIELSVLALLSTVAVAAVVRKERLVWLLFLLGLLLKGGALFHPSYWYPDVRLHRHYVEVFEASPGGLLERGIAAQKASGTAYPRELAGRQYAFPYSPLIYVPFAAMSADARGIERAMKLAGLLLASLELPLVYALARYLLGSSVAIWAALLVPFVPPMTSRLLFAQWPTLAGHTLDLVAWLFAARFVRNPASNRHLGLYFGASFLSCLVYISSLFHFTLFTSFLALYERRRALVLLSAGALVGVATILLLYHPFLALVASEVLPALGTAPEVSGTPRPTPTEVLGRVPLFYGSGFPALAIAGLVLAKRRSETAFRFLAVYGSAFLALLLLRLASGAFKDLKEVVFVGPLVAVTAGASLEALWSRGRYGRLAAAAILVGLAGFGLSKLSEYTGMHTGLAGR